MEKCTGVETWDAPEDSQSLHTELSRAETQVFHDPDATQFADTQFVDLNTQLDESCRFYFVFEEECFTGQATVTCTRVLRELDMVEFNVRPSLIGRGLSAVIEIHELETYVSKWHAVRIVSPTQTPVREFVNNLSLADVGLAETTLDLQILPGDRLKATLTNTLKGPIETQIVLFECVCDE